MKLRHMFVPAVAALIPAAASADSDGLYNCPMFGGMMGGWGGSMMGYGGYGGGGWLISVITTVLVWLVLALLAAYLWKKVK